MIVIFFKKQCSSLIGIDEIIESVGEIDVTLNLLNYYFCFQIQLLIFNVITHLKFSIQK